MNIDPIALTPPRRITGYSAWVPHIPFAFTLVQLLRPRTLVELGTHNGDSYCAFCQAVDLLQLPTQCTAIDTWAGDDSAGRYDSTALQNLRAHHDPLYANFSTLRQSTFADAASTFPQKSIDLLHIDGSHDYPSVKADYENYRPRLSDRAVVLFHDTQVTTAHFGVHQLWRELTPCHAHFEFHHAYGLGVLAVGQNPPPALLEFLDTANASPEHPRALYAALGQRLEFARALALLSQQLPAQLAAANAQRNAHHIPPLPDFSFPTNPPDFLLPSIHDPKALLDRLAFYAASITGDLTHFASLNPAAKKT